jgi:hypothetical protein
MATLMIGYDLNKPGKDYEPLIKAIKELGTWWHHLDSTWLVKSAMTASEARDTLKAHLDGNDELLVIDVTGQARAWSGFNESGSKWLKETYE